MIEFVVVVRKTPRAGSYRRLVDSAFVFQKSLNDNKVENGSCGEARQIDEG